MEVLINKNDDGLTVEIKPKSGVDAGRLKAFGEDRGFKITIRNSLNKAVRIREWNYQEDCFKFKVLPDAVKANSDEDIRFSIDAEGLSGSFNKSIICQIEIEGNAKDIGIPVKFTVAEENSEPPKDKGVTGNGEKADEAGFQIEFRDYREGGIEKYPEAGAWIFAGKNCPGCNYLRRMLLPQLFDREHFKGKPVVVEVDIDRNENFLFLVEIEEKLKSKGDKTPILYWKGKLIYGNESVESMLKNGGK
ncbi:MAG: hypothetical protein WCS96_06490 [Victivallales bacterium]